MQKILSAHESAGKRCDSAERQREKRDVCCLACRQPIVIQNAQMTLAANQSRVDCIMHIHQQVGERSMQNTDTLQHAHMLFAISCVWGTSQQDALSYFVTNFLTNLSDCSSAQQVHPNFGMTFKLSQNFHSFKD
jgi:hypothetical protein